MITANVHVLQALGAEDDNHALRLIAETNQFLANAKELTGKDSLHEILAALNAAVSIQKQVETTTEKSGAEALGVVLAWKSNAAELPGVQTKLAEATKQVEDKERTELIKQAQDNRQATKAFAEKHLATLSIEALRSFVATADRVLPMKVEQPQASAGSALASVAAVDFEGKKYEEIAPAVRAEMAEKDQVLFNTLREDWVSRGRPAFEVA